MVGGAGVERGRGRRGVGLGVVLRFSPLMVPLLMQAQLPTYAQLGITCTHRLFHLRTAPSGAAGS